LANKRVHNVHMQHGHVHHVRQTSSSDLKIQLRT